MDQNPQQLAELTSRYSTSEALAVLTAYEEQRQKDQYVKYWSATPAQAEIFPRFAQNVKVFGILGGNRSGKTEMGAFIAVAWALGKDYFRDEPAWEYVQHLPIPDPPNNVWVVGLDYKVLKNVIWREKIRFGQNHPPLLPKDPKILSRKPNDTDFEIFFANGSVITGKSADSGREKFQSASVDLVWIDEEPESEIYDECWQRTIDCGGKILLTLTPLTDIASGVRTPWVHDLYEDWRKGNKSLCFSHLSVLENPYVPGEEKEKVKEKWAGHPEEKARLYGEFVQRAGLVYPEWKPATHCVQPFRIPREWRRIVSIDPAATGVTAVVWGAISPTNDIYLYREYYESNLVVSDHAKNILIRNAGDPVDIWLIDPKWGSQRNPETHRTNEQLYRDAGIPVRRAPIDSDYGLNKSREYVVATTVPASRHPRLFVWNDLWNFRYEIEHYTWAVFGKGELKGLSKEKPIKRNDHLMNAFQYLCSLQPKGRRIDVPVHTDEERRRFAQLNSYT